MWNRISIIALAVVVAAACGSSSAKKPDAPAAIDAFASACGQPGDVGNDKGVGKFCTQLSDCEGNQMATLCSIIGDSTTHFCTTTCTCPGTGSATCTVTGCGTDASCTCDDSHECGCTPNVCLN